MGHVSVLAFPGKGGKKWKFGKDYFMYNNLNLSVKTLPKCHIEWICESGSQKVIFSNTGRRKILPNKFSSCFLCSLRVKKHVIHNIMSFYIANSDDLYMILWILWSFPKVSDLQFLWPSEQLGCSFLFLFSFLLFYFILFLIYFIFLLIFVVWGFLFCFVGVYCAWGFFSRKPKVVRHWIWKS